MASSDRYGQQYLSGGATLRPRGSTPSHLGYFGAQSKALSRKRAQKAADRAKTGTRRTPTSLYVQGRPISPTASPMPTYGSIEEYGKAKGWTRGRGRGIGAGAGAWYSDPGTQLMGAEGEFRQYQTRAEAFNRQLGEVQQTQSQLDYYTSEQAREAEEARKRAEADRARALKEFEGLRADYPGEEFVGDIYDRETQARQKQASEAITRRYEAGARGRSGAADEERMNATMRIQREGLIDKALAEYRASQEQRGWETDIASRIAGILGTTTYQRPDYSDVIAQLIAQGGKIGTQAQQTRTTTTSGYGVG